MYLGPVRLAVTPAWSGPKVPTAEVPNVYLALADSKRPRVSAQAVTGASGSSQLSIPSGRAPIWILSWMRERSSEAKA
jgi:hypothetical protein